MLDLAEAIMNSRDQEVVPMQAGRPAIVRGYVNFITILIRSQNKTKAFSVRQLKRLNRELSKSINENLKYLDPASKKDISSEIEQLSEKSGGGSGSKDLTKVLKVLKN